MGLFQKKQKPVVVQQGDHLRAVFADLLKRAIACSNAGKPNPELRAEAYGFIEGLRVTGSITPAQAAAWKTHFHTLAMEARPLGEAATPPMPAAA